MDIFILVVSANHSMEPWYSWFSSVLMVLICISEVIDISPGSLDSSLCFIQPGISHGVLCI